jgi:hypothetical protein
MTPGAAELKFDTDGNLHITNPTGTVIVNGRQVSGNEVSELRKRVADVELERDEALKLARNERASWLKQVQEAEQERDAEQARADRLEEEVRRGQLDLSEWPSGWAVGINGDGLVCGVRMCHSGIWVDDDRISLDGIVNSWAPLVVIHAMKLWHRSLGRPCPWDTEPDLSGAVENEEPPSTDDAPIAVMREEYGELLDRVAELERKVKEDGGTY